MIVIKCPRCNDQLNVEDSLAGQSVNCPACGNTTVVPSRAPAGPSFGGFGPAAGSGGMGGRAKCPRIAYILLGVFLGGFGVHNFLAGYTNKGLIQLIVSVCTVGIGYIPMHIWAIVEVCTVTVDANGVPME